MTTEQHIHNILSSTKALFVKALFVEAAHSSLILSSHIPHFEAAAEACALAIAEYLQARQDQRDKEMEAMTERGQDAAEEARGRSGKFHYDEEMPLDEAFEG
jgi:hypothetical protein